MSKETKLRRAVREGDINTLRHFTSSRNLPSMKDWRDDKGYSLLHFAIGSGQEEIAKLLLVSGAKISPMTARYANTLLYDATERGYIKIIEMLLDRGANVDEVNNKRMSSLHCAASKGGYAEIMELLLKNGASVNACCGLGKMPFHYAVESGNVQNIERLLNQGALVNGTTCKETVGSYILGEETVKRLHDSRGYTPLHYACRLDNEKIVKLLLSRGANINAVADNNSTALHVAAERKLEKNVKLLLAHGEADINARASNGKTILHIAVEMTDLATLQHILKSRHDINEEIKREVLQKALYEMTSETSIKIVNTLIENGFTVCSEDAHNFRLLNAAVRKGSLKIVEDLLKYGADITQTSTRHAHLSRSAGRYFSLLHTAVGNGHIEVAKLLIQQGIDVNVKNETGKTPIFYAIHAMNANMIKLLLSSGANINDRDESGITPLHYLALSKNHINPNDKMLKYLKRIGKKCYVKSLSATELADQDFIQGEIAKLFLSRGASVEAVTDNGFTALHIAAAGRHVNIVEALLACNADVNCVALQDGNKTPLHYSAAAGSEIICKMLVENGAKLNVKDNNGKTALHAACYCSRAEVVEALLKYGSEIDSRDNKGSTPLQTAAVQGSSEIVKILLLQGVSDVDSTSKNGRTALHSALLWKRLQVVKDLLDYGSDINRTCEGGTTSFNYARKLPRDQIAQKAWERRQLERPSRSYYTSGLTSETDEEDEYNDRRPARLPRSYYTSDLTSETDEEYEYNERNFIKVEDLRQVCKILHQHTFKLKALNLFVSEENLDSLDWDYLEYKFDRDCENEIDKLKSTKICDSHVYFHDILTKGTTQLSSYAKNESIVEALEFGDYKSMFPLYSGMIYMRFRKAHNRNRLLNSSANSLNSLTGFELPDLSLVELLSYLSDKDLKNLIKAGAKSRD